MSEKWCLRRLIMMFTLVLVGVWNAGVINVKAYYGRSSEDEDGTYVSTDGDYELGYTYVNNNKEVEINGFAIKDEEDDAYIVIPSEINGKKVTGIKEGLFSDCGYIKGITIPDTVTCIGDRTFLCCTNLETIHIPSTVTAIGELAFDGTQWLADRQKENALVIINDILVDGSTYKGEAELPDNVRMIADGAFAALTISEYGYESWDYGTNDGLTGVKCNGNLNAIGNRAFYNCTALTDVSLGSGLKTIGDMAFKGCTNLPSITVPEGVTYIGANAFVDCTGLTEVTLPDSIKNIGLWVFGNTKWLKNKEAAAENDLIIEKHILLDGTKASGNVEIPSNVTVIADYAFCIGAARQNTGLTGIEIKGAVEAIPESAFAWCSNITFITIPDTVTDIGEQAFESCTGLEYIVLSENLTSIGDSSFNNCTQLDKVIIPLSVKRIGDRAFYGCTGMESITIGEGVEEVGEGAFEGTKWLEDFRNSRDTALIVNNILVDGKNMSGDVVISSDITSINSDAFAENTEMTSVTIAEGVMDRLGDVFADCKGLTTINLPDSITEIDVGAFSGCESLTDINVNDSNSLYSTEGGILYSKDKDELVVYPRGKSGGYEIPDTVTRIAAGAFVNCSKLGEIILPTNIAGVDENAFGDGREDESGDDSNKVNIIVPEDMDISNVGLENIQNASRVVICVAEGSIAELYLEEFNLYIQVITYPSKNGKEDDATPKSDETGKGEDGSIQQDDKQSTGSDIQEGGKSSGSDNGDAQQDVKKAEIGKIYIAAKGTYKVTSATEAAFTAPKSKSIKKVTIPATVTIMNQSYKVTAVSRGACKNCKKLTTVTVGSNVKSIGDEAFMNCAKLNKVTVGKNVTSIGKKVFFGDKKLKKLIFKGANVKKVGKNALSKVPKKVKITAPKKAVSKYKKLLNKAK